MFRTMNFRPETIIQLEPFFYSGVSGLYLTQAARTNAAGRVHVTLASK